MLSHIEAWTQGRPLLPALRNSGRFLTIPLSKSFYTLSVNGVTGKNPGKTRVKDKIYYTGKWSKGEQGPS